MAATLKTLAAGLARQKSLFNLSNSSKLIGYQFSRGSHLLPKDDSEEKVVLTDNGDTIVCWHPAPKWVIETIKSKISLSLRRKFIFNIILNRFTALEKLLDKISKAAQAWNQRSLKFYGFLKSDEQLSVTRFPYECSLPIPTNTIDVNKMLKMQTNAVAEIFHFQSPQQQREYLTKVTATTKHRWFPRLAVKYSRKNTKPDREYL